jgi:uncharacterized membrane protein YedE/YeeE
VLSTGRAFMFLSFAKIVLWVVAVTLALSWTGLGDHQPPMGYSVGLRSLAGGFLFGVGAAVNRGCAFSTLTHLGSGDLQFSATLAGFVLGVGLYLQLASALPAPDVVLTWSPLVAPDAWRLPVALVVWAWAGWELWRLWRSRPRSKPWRERLFASRYRLSAGAALIGISNAFLFTAHGSWAYTGALAETVEDLAVMGPGVSPLRGALALALMAGIVFSAVQSRRFRLRVPRSSVWLLHLVGGTIMGLGAALVPGGNFVLILQGIPSLSPHALPAFAALTVGIAVALLVTRAVTGKTMRVTCGGDICRD